MEAKILKKKEPYKTTKGTYTKILAELEGKETYIYSAKEDDLALDLEVGCTIDVEKNNKGAYMLSEKPIKEKIDLDKKPVDPDGVFKEESVEKTIENVSTTEREISKDQFYLAKVKEAHLKRLAIEDLIRKDYEALGYSLDTISQITTSLFIQCSR
jgi:hypothetical protein